MGCRDRLGTRAILASLIWLATGAPSAAATEHLRAPYQVFPLGNRTPFWYTQGRGPTDVASGDLNGDGRADLAVVCRDGEAIEGGSTLSILLSDTSPNVPTMMPAATYATNLGPQRVALGDLDNDGRMDVVTADAGGDSISVFLNVGGGVLGPRQSYPIGATPQGLVIADLNGDGRLDLALAAGSSARVFLATGAAGSFAPVVVYPVTGSAFAIGVGAVDGDGVPDLVLATGTPHTLTILHGLGNGAFVAGSTPPLLYPPSSLQLADMNGNGTLEAVVTSSANPHLTVYQNDGVTPFTTISADVVPSGSPLDLVATDLNGDGAKDVALAMQIGAGGSFGTGAVYVGDGAGGFASNFRFDFGPFLEAIAAGDLNGDGNPDLAACGAGQVVDLKFQRAVHVVLATGPGTFGIGSSYRTEVNDATICRAPLIADMDRDGKEDLIIAGANQSTLSASITIRPGLGNGAWDPGFEFIVPGDQLPHLATGDFNRDGKIDLVASLVSSTTGTTMATYLGNGNGTIVPLGASFLSSYRVITAADFDRDGKLDVLAVNLPTRGLAILKGAGDGTFTPLSEVPTFTPFGPGTAFVGDLNRDGKWDVICQYPGVSGSGDYIFLGNGDGTLGTGTYMSFINWFFTFDDLDQDGILDAIGSTGNSTNLFRGNGDGTFQPQILLGGNGTNEGSARHVVTDVNRDGHPDIVLDSYPFPDGVVDSKIDVYLGNGTMNFGATSFYGVGRQTLGIVAVDANRDGRSDVVAAEDDPGFGADTPWLLTLLGNGPASFDFPATRPVTPLPSPPLALATADFTRDGKLDLVVTRQEATGDYATLLVGNGNGTFTAGISTLMPSEPVAAAVGDLNRDAIPDVAIACGISDAVVIQLGTPYDTLSAPMTVAAGLGYEYSDIAIADFNRDGKPDLAAASAATYSILMFPGNGNGTFGAPVVVSTGSGGPSSIAVGDVDRDGIPDIVAALGTGISPNSIGVLRGVGDGTFQTIRPYAAGASPYAIALADLNRDGILDAAVTRTGLSGSRYIAVLYGSSGGGFGAPTPYAITGNALDVVAADIDGDGFLDLFAPNGFGTDSFSFLHGLGGISFEQNTDYFLANDPYALAIGDFNCDGRPDIAGTPAGEAKVVVVLSSPSSVSAVAMEPAGEAPLAPRLAIRPNPAARRAVLSFRLPRPGSATVDVFDVRGRRVARLYDGRAEGDLEVAWMGETQGGGRAASGVYFARLTAGNSSVSRRLVWLR